MSYFFLFFTGVNVGLMLQYSIRELFVSSIWVMIVNSFCWAMWIGFLPCLSSMFLSAPRKSNFLTTLPLPETQARCKGVRPWESVSLILRFFKEQKKLIACSWPKKDAQWTGVLYLLSREWRSIFFFRRKNPKERI